MASFKRRLHNIAKANLRRAFRLGQRFGVDILPRHFYSSIPDMRQLEQSSYWRKPVSMIAVQGIAIESQLEFVAQCCPVEIRDRVQRMGLHDYASKENGAPGYGVIEADFLYCFIYTHRPGRIVQVGAGVSTAIILRAAKDAGYQVDLTCIDPFPEQYLRRLATEKKITLRAEPAQAVDLRVLTELGEQGMLFIDSTHTVKAGSEVNRLILEALPRLPVGTFVHFHDIYFPYDYQRSIMTEPFFNSESTLLHAFLSCNDRYTLRTALSMLHYAKPEELRQFLPNYRPQAGNEGLRTGETEGHFPSATYLQMIR